MGTVFLIDAHTAVLANSEINDTIPLEFGDTQVLNGSFVVNVPFGVPIDGTPANLTDLLTNKFTGLLAYYPGYTYIDYDEGIDSTNWNASASSGVGIGDRGSTYLHSSSGLLSSSAVTLTGAAPANAIVTWEVFERLNDNPKDGVMVHTYTEVDPSDLSISVSFDNGVNFNTVTDGVQFTIAAFQQGTQFIFRCTNSSGRRLWVGSWAVIY